MNTTYTVIDEQTLEDVPPPAPAARANAPKTQDASEVAELIEEIAGKAVAQAMSQGSKLAREMISDCEKQIALLSNLYSKPQALCMHVKINEAPIKKLKQRVAKVLPDLLLQGKLGQAGNKWPLMIGPKGSGKTVAARQVAEVLGLAFSHLNCCEGMSETWLFGRQTPNGFIPGEFFLRFKNGGVFLFDEFDAMNENVLLSINTALANGHLTNPINGETCTRHADFICIAAANTNGKGGTAAYTGRNRLDAASLNRFAMFQVEYDLELERTIAASQMELLELLWDIRVKLSDKNALDSISTRDIANAVAQADAGMSIDRILNCLKLSVDKGNAEFFVAPEPKTKARAKKAEKGESNDIPS